MQRRRLRTLNEQSSTLEDVDWRSLAKKLKRLEDNAKWARENAEDIARGSVDQERDAFEFLAFFTRVLSTTAFVMNDLDRRDLQRQILRVEKEIDAMIDPNRR